MIFDNNYHYNAMPIRLLVNIQDADSAGIQTASENNNGTRMGYNRPMEKNTLSARAPSPWLPLLLAIAIFMQMLDATILNTALPEIAADLNESPPDMQQAVVAYTLTVALLIPLSSYLADKFGTKKSFSVRLPFLCSDRHCAPHRVRCLNWRFPVSFRGSAVRCWLRYRV